MKGVTHIDMLALLRYGKKGKNHNYVHVTVRGAYVLSTHLFMSKWSRRPNEVLTGVYSPSAEGIFKDQPGAAAPCGCALHM